MEWKEVRLGDVCSIQRGASPRPIQKFISKEGMPWVKIADATGISSRYINSTSEYIIKEGVSKSRIVYPGDLIVSNSATPGLPKFMAIEACVHDGWLIIRDFDGIDKVFLYYVFLNIRRRLSNQANGSVFMNLKTDIVKDFVIKLPTLDDQRRIASILSSLDRKIELNNKINADLEEMAQAIFKNWFVDFEPFKDGKFVDSELGMIPEGWKVSQIADIPHILETGKRPKGGAVEKGIPSVGAEHVKGMCAYDYSKTKYINCEFAAKLKTGKINGYELMIYKDGGKPGYFIPNFSIFGEGYPFENCYLNEHVFKLDFDGHKDFNIFCYFFFKTEQIMSYFNAQGAKAAIPGINKKDVENIYIFSPDNESVIKFGEFAYPLFKQMLKNAIENRTLSLLRDTLLPRLMSGEIEVPD